jgi:C1A family cysteine protease
MTQNLALKTKIDLRSQFPQIRDQRTRPLCLAFASSDLNSYANGLNHPLSVEYLSYYAYEDFSNTNFESGLTVLAVSSVLRSRGQPSESAFPYQVESDKPLEPPSDDFKEKLFSIGEEKALTPSEIIQSLESGIPVIVGIALTNTFFNPKAPYVIDLEDGNYGGHALIIVGYGEHNNGKKYFLVRNSWGAQWADSGHAWLSADYITKKSITFMELRVCI